MEVLNFYFRRQSFCLEISKIAEVLNSTVTFPLPGIPPVFEGVFQVRGKIISLLNFPRCFGGYGQPAETQIIVFAEPAPHFAIRVPAPVEARTLEFGATQWAEGSEPLFAILEGTASDGNQIHHLISPVELVAHAKNLIRSWRGSLETKNSDR
jgi:chemotaxis signal transduction protein